MKFAELFVKMSAVEKKATPGPWTWQNWSDEHGDNLEMTLTAPPETCVPPCCPDFSDLGNVILHDEESTSNSQDRDFIVLARGYVPASLIQLDAAYKEILKLSAQVRGFAKVSQNLMVELDTLQRKCRTDRRDETMETPAGGDSGVGMCRKDCGGPAIGVTAKSSSGARRTFHSWITLIHWGRTSFGQVLWPAGSRPINRNTRTTPSI